jgi:hypothetical protein
VRRLADDPQLRSRVIAGGFTTAEYFDVAHLTDSFEAWYTQAAAGYPDGHPPSRSFSLDAP